MPNVTFRVKKYPVILKTTAITIKTFIYKCRAASLLRSWFLINLSSTMLVFLVSGPVPFQSSFPYHDICNFIEITLWHGCAVNLLDIFRAPFTENNFVSGGFKYGFLKSQRILIL